MNRAGEEIFLGIADAIHVWSRSHGLKEGVKVLAEHLGEHWVTTYKRLRGELPLTPLHLRVMARAMGKEHGRTLWQEAVGDEYIVAADLSSESVEDLTQTGARSLRAEGRFIDDLCEAVADGEISRAEADRLIRDANDVESLCESLKRAIRRRARK